jgi:lysophospholipase L1-like esterase
MSWWLLVAAAVPLASSCTRAGSLPDGRVEQWLGTWEAAPQLTERQNLPPVPGLSGRTLRQVVHVSIGGSPVRVRLSNEFGDGPLRIASVHLARSVGRDSVDGSTDVQLSFDGRAAATIPAGATARSDPASFSLAALSNVAVTMEVVSAPAAVTGHPGSRTTSYLADGPAGASTLGGAVTTDHWYLLSGVEVRAPASVGAVVVLGNSIADGRGSGTNRNNRWPDNLARRLQGRPRARDVAVLNAGIGGNAVLRGGLGPTALARLERDVLSQPGARWVIVSEGVNDIGAAANADSAASVARQLPEAYREIVRRAHARGLRVYGATILPFGGSFYARPERETARQAVNAWIRGSGVFDAVIDLDAALRDPADAARLRGEADSGDHLHPNERGYEMIADAIDLGLFVLTSGRS